MKTKPTYEQLEQNQERYRTILESMIEPIFISNQLLEILYMNNAMIQRIGYDGTGEKCFNAIHGFDTICPWCNQKAIEKGEAHLLNITSPKDNNTFEISSTPIKNHDGSISILNVFRNVTEINTLKQQIQQSQKMEAIGTLAGGIAHDFNNILFPIVGYTEMLLDDLSEDSPLRANLNEIHTGAIRARKLVDQILSFSRQKNREAKTMKIQPVLREALKLIRSTIPSTIRIKKNIQPDCSTIIADPTQIHQIIMNLLTNAYHAMEETGGEMVVSLMETQLTQNDLRDSPLSPGSYACLSVSDTGIGMNKEIIEKIFDPFFTTKINGKGTGMGLAVVQEIVISLGGKIEVHSQQEKRTEFKIFIPAFKNDDNKALIEPKTDIPNGNEHILIVDDDEMIIAMTQQMLKRLGYKITTCSSSPKALKLFQENPDMFDLIITDMTMPDMTGDQLVKKIRDINSNLPVILCTGYSGRINEEKAKAIGVSSFLMKPIIQLELARKVRDLLDTAARRSSCQKS